MAVFGAVSLIGGCFALQQWLAQEGAAEVEQIEEEEEDMTEVAAVVVAVAAAIRSEGVGWIS